MTKKSDKLKKIDAELKDLERKKKHIEQKTKNQIKINKRKQRARRLIETGALAEKYFELDEDLPMKDREEIFKMFSNFVVSNKPKQFRNNKEPKQ